QAFAQLGWGRRSQYSEYPFWSQYLGTLNPLKQQGRPLANVSCEVRKVGPFALRRTVRIETSDRILRLELGRGLELGVGMPKWLRSARAFVQDKEIGTLRIERGLVNLLSPSGTECQGTWRFEGRLLSYIGTPKPIVYGDVEWAGKRLGELLA